ncbi:unnamed protein product [Brassicogethes aeneus]|uniref:Uncharacterized protein n=1 Tax=Brassicogethes aeneus TaxID=1431903 RepID=A0A9P0B5E3_BRAAE|nr:unnamed protein product [Brassicogethes aeneus]
MKKYNQKLIKLIKYQSQIQTPNWQKITKKIYLINQTTNIAKLSIDAEKITQLKEKVDSNELPDLNANELNLQHSELSNDLFASLQVPTGCQNPESTSPTAAFLLTFPLVSTSNGVKVTEVIDEENSESQRGTPNLLQIGTMTNTRTTVSQSDALTPSLLNLDNFSFFTGKEFANYSNSYTTPSNIFSNSFKSTTPSIISTNIFSNNYTFTFTTASSIVTPSVFTNSTNTDNKKIKTFFDPLPYNINEKIIENPKSAAYSQIPNLLSDNIVPTPSTITLQPSQPPPSMRPKIPSSFDVMQPIIHSTLSMQPKLQNAPPKTSFSLGLQPPINNLPPITTFTTSFPPKLHNTPSSTSFNMHTSQSMQPAIHTLPLTTSASMQPKLHPAPPTTTFNVQSMVPPTTMASMQPKTHVSPPKLRNMQPTLQSQSSSTSFNSFNTFPITTTVSMQLKSHAVTPATSFNSTQPPPTTTVSMQPKIHISTNLFNAPRTSFNVQSIAPPKLLQTAPPNTLFSNVQSLAPPMQSKIHPLPPTSFNVQSIAPPSSQPKLHFNAPPINQSTFSMQPKLHHAPPTTSFNVQSIAPPTSFNLQSIAPPLNTFSMQPKLHNNVIAPPTSFDMHPVAPSRSMQPIQHTIHPPTSINMQPGSHSLPIKAVLDPQKEIKNYHHHNNKAYANAQIGNESNSARTNCSSYNPKSSNNAVSSYSYYGDSSNFNTNCYKNINKNDNKGYYSMPTYDNYENYKKCDNFSDNYYAPTQNPSKDKFNSPPKSKQPSQSKPPINWMTAPDNRIQTDYFLPPLSKENEFTVYPNNSQTTYFNTNTMYSTSEITMNDNTRKTIDLPINPSLSNNYQRTDLEEWSPAKMPQFLDPLVGDLGLNHIYEPKTDKRVKDATRRSKNVNYDNQTNFLSVSQLVDSNKNENVPARTTTRRNSGNRAKTQQVKQKRKSQEAKEMPSNANKSDGLKNTQQMNKFVASFNNQDIFCENPNNKPKNSSSNYTAEALIGHTNNIINDANKKQNYTNKTLVPPPFLTDNIITYFPPVEFTQENTYIPQNQAYNSNSFTHNFGTFQNTSYTANNFIPATNTITTTYIPTNNFVHDTHDFISDNFNNIFSTPVKEKPCPKPNRNVNSNTEKNLNQNCTNTYKKGKKKPPHDTNINNFDIQFLSMPGNRNSPLLPDDFHTHTTYIPPPTTYKTINPFSHNNNKTSDMSSTPLLPLPPVPGARNSNQPEILPVNSSGTSLTNFNLSTIFPEINKGPIPELYSRNKDQGSNRNYNPSTSTAIQAPFSTNKSSFNFNYNNN